MSMKRRHDSRLFAIQYYADPRRMTRLRKPGITLSIVMSVLVVTALVAGLLASAGKPGRDRNLAMTVAARSGRHRPVPIPISREGLGRRYVVPTRFLTPEEFRRTLGKGFEVRDLRGLQIITPPWNFVDLARRFRPAVEPLVRLEDRIGSRRGLRALGAIYLQVFRRTSE